MCDEDKRKMCIEDFKKGELPGDREALTKNSRF